MSKEQKPTVAITGASGFLGTALTRHFTGSGWNVIALVRNAERYESRAQVTYREYDLGAPVQKSALGGANYLVHAAFIKKDRQHPDAMDLNIAAAERILAVSRASGVGRNIFISSMSAHTGAVSAYGRQKLAIEQFFSTDADVSLRPGLIIGNGGIVKRMADFMRSKHLVPLIGGGRQPLQVVGVDDLARVIEKAILSDLHGVMTIAHPKVYTYRQFYEELSTSLKIKVLFLPVPFSLLLGMLKIVDFLHLPLDIGSDNLLGLKMLRSVETASDLKRLDVQLDDLKTLLSKDILG